MPVSPQDFELYSRMTGAPMPTDAMSRMQMAPEVFKFTKDFAKKPNILEKTGNLIKTVGKIGLMGLGEGYRQSQANEQRAIEEQLRNKAATTQSEAVTMDDPIEEVAPAPELTAIEKGELDKQQTARIKTDEQIRLEQARAKLRNIAVEKPDTPIKGSYTRRKMIQTDPPQYEEEVIDPFPQEPTTSDSYGQDYVPNQTASNIVDRKISQGSQIADSTPNIAEVLSENQDSQPSGEMVGGEGKNQLAKFLSQKGLDQALLGAIGERMTPEPRIGDSSPLIDHPDLPGGEDDTNLPSGTNTSPTTNLQEQTGGGKSLNKRYIDHADEMRRMEAQERRKRKSPSDRQINLLEQRAIDNQEAIDSGFMSMSDEERANETARLGGDRIREMAEKSPDGISQTDLKRTGVLSGQLTRFPAGEETEKATERKRLRREKNAKAEDFKAKFVEGALSDIVRGARSKKSLGITRIPATNGDAQVGFVLADKAVPEMPKNVPLDSPLRDETGALRNPYGGAKYSTTYGFGVAPGAEDMLQNQITDKDSFSNYMRRGLGEAKEGKRRKAGEIFEFLPPSARIVSGTARLDDIVM